MTKQIKLKWKNPLWARIISSILFIFGAVAVIYYGIIKNLDEVSVIVFSVIFVIILIYMAIRVSKKESWEIIECDDYELIEEEKNESDTKQQETKIEGTTTTETTN